MVEGIRNERLSADGFQTCGVKRKKALVIRISFLFLQFGLREKYRFEALEGAGK